MTALALHDVPWDVRTSNLALFRTQVAQSLKPFRLLATSAGRYEASIVRRRLAKLELMLISYGAEITIDAGRLHRLPLLQVPLVGSYHFHGDDGAVHVPQRTAHLLPPASPLVMEWSDDCLLLVIRLSAATANDWPIGQSQELKQALVGFETAQGRALGSLIDYIVAEALSGRTLVAFPELALKAEALLLESVAAAFARETPGTAVVPGPVRRAERFMMSRIGDPELAPKEVAQAAEVSMRTLYRQFQNTHGCPPLTWLRERRLDLSRLLLEQGGPKSVTAAAATAGFTHMGRFSASFRARFGQEPRLVHRKNAHSAITRAKG